MHKVKTDGSSRRNREIHKYEISTPLSLINRTRRQKINKDIKDINKTINQHDLSNIYRTLHPNQQNMH